MSTIVDDVLAIPVGHTALTADVALPALPPRAAAVIARDASGAGAGTLAAGLAAAGFASAAVDLLTPGEAQLEAAGRYRCDGDLLSARLVAALRWLAEQPWWSGLDVVGAARGAAAAAMLLAAAERHDAFSALAVRDAPVEALGERLAAVTAPTLLITGGDDAAVARQRAALARLPGDRALRVGFADPTAEDDEAIVAWFARYA